MATEAAHLLKAQHNQAFLGSLDDRFPEWLAIVAFYKAVHLVEALFARSNIHSERHHERNRRLQEYHPEIWVDFRVLYDVGRLVRYSERGISAANARKHLIEHRLSAVEATIMAKLHPRLPAVGAIPVASPQA
jgi:hypothetical protein